MKQHTSKFRHRIPAAWTMVTVTVPRGETPESYADDIEVCLAVRDFSRTWAWTAVDGNSSQIVLATARLTSMPVLLACVTGINRLAEHPPVSLVTPASAAA